MKKHKQLKESFRMTAMDRLYGTADGIRSINLRYDLREAFWESEESTACRLILKRLWQRLTPTGFL